MRQIAEFVAVLACSLFAGASVYINLVEHPARMECGVELAATEFSPSQRHASDLGSGGSPVFHYRMVCRGELPVGRWRAPAGRCHPIHAHRNPADQQAVAQSCAGQAFGTDGSATCSLGQIACREKCPLWCGSAAVLELGDLREVLLRM